MKLVVFGASGNIGTSLLTHLAQRDIGNVTAVARRPGVGFVPGVEWVAADISSDPLDLIVKGADAIVHLAWEIQPSHDRNRLWRTNVYGSRRILEAAAAAKVGTILYSSSVGVYSAGPKLTPVDEGWERNGVPTSTYSRQKAEVERLVDTFEGRYPNMRIIRIRPGLVFKRDAAASIHRLFVGKIPRAALVRSLKVAVPNVESLAIQVIHADDVGAAIAAALVSDLDGPFNLATWPVVDGPLLADMLGAAKRSIPLVPLRWAMAAGWHARVSAAEPGWLDLAVKAPLMSTQRARDALGWEPQYSAHEAVRELLEGFWEGTDGPTPALMRHPPAINPALALRPEGVAT